jgi:3-oxoacyl-ACP reductase-like protein
VTGQGAESIRPLAGNWLLRGGAQVAIDTPNLAEMRLHFSA